MIQFDNREEGQNRDLEKNTVQPLTVRMCLEAKKEIPGMPYTINGVEINNVEIVGLILESNHVSNFTVYKIDDGTGFIEVRQWQSGEEELSSHLKEGSYARACGSLKQTGENKEIVAFSIHSIVDFNEITYHTLHITYAYLVRTKRVIKPETFSSHYPKNPAMNQRNSVQVDRTPRMFSPQNNNNNAGMALVSPNENFNRSISNFTNNNSSTNDCGVEIKSLLKTDKSDRGFSRQEIIQHFHGKYSEREIMRTIDGLYDDGAIFNSRFGVEYYTIN